MWVKPLACKSIDGDVLCEGVENNWMTPIKNYILNDSLPANEMEARKVRTTAARYLMSKSAISYNGRLATLEINILRRKEPCSMRGPFKYIQCAHWHSRTG